MNKLNTILLWLITATIFLSFNNPDSRKQINPLLGDISFVAKFGKLPDATTDEDLRIKTHLEYIENLLSKKDVSRMKADEKRKRNHLLGLLHDYWTSGVFPRNHDYADQRKPCFIDKDERICAVGYLVEQTAGRDIAEQINNKHRYERIYEMQDISVDKWIANSGLTKEECAMIQPAYGGNNTSPLSGNNISSLNGVTSALFGGVNLSLNIINGIQIAKEETNKTIPTIGLFTGAMQIVFGSITLKNASSSINPNESLKTLSFINIGMGTSTLILTSWNIVSNEKRKEKKAAWNIYGFPTQKNNMGLGFSMCKRF